MPAGRNATKLTALILLLFAGMLSWYFKSAWFPFVAAKLSMLGAHASSLQGLESLVNVALAVFNGLMGLLMLLQVKSKIRPVVETRRVSGGKGSTPVYSIPTSRVLRSAIPNFSTTLENRSEWLQKRLIEAKDGLIWVDKDCGFEAEDYLGLPLEVKSERLSSSYVVNMESEGLFRPKNSKKEFRSNDILHLFETIRAPIVLLGDPGGGKSVTIRRLGIEIASARMNAKGEDKRLLPIYVHLGDYIGRTDKGSPDTIKQFIMGNVARIYELREDSDIAAADANFQSEAEKGRLVFLFDSMDEMPRDDYVARYDEIRALIRKYPLCRYVFACRKLDYDHRLNVTEVLVEPFQPAQVRRYLARFLMGRAKFSGFAVKKIIDQMNRENKDIFTFLANPFYLKMAAVYIGRLGKTPASFAAMYQFLAQHLWNQQQDGKTGKLGGMDFKEFQNQLSTIAYIMTFDKGVGTAMDVPMLFSKSIEIMGGRFDSERFNICLGIGKHLKLLQVREFGERRVSFQHHKFQEYFTAVFLSDKHERLSAMLPSTGILGGIWWQETIVLLSSLAPRAESIFEYLLNLDLTKLIEYQSEVGADLFAGERFEILSRCYEASKGRISSSMQYRILAEMSSSLPNTDPVRRVAFTRALSRFDLPQADFMLSRNLDDPSGWVREEAFLAILFRKSSAQIDKKFLMRFLCLSVWEQKAYTRGKSVVKALVRQGASLDMVFLSVAATAIGFIGHNLHLALTLVASGLFYIQGVHPVLALGAVSASIFASIWHIRIFTTMTIRRQLSGVGFTSVLVVYVLSFHTMFAWPIVLLLGVGIFTITPFLMIGALSLVSREKLENLFLRLEKVRSSHDELHEEMLALRKRVSGFANILRVPEATALRDLYIKGCMHVQKDVVDTIRESLVTVESYALLKAAANNLSADDPHAEDFWQVLQEKQLQLRREMYNH